MININEFREFVLFVMNKSGNGETPTPAEFNRVTDQALAEWTSIKIGNPKAYQPGRPIAPESIEITERVIEDLRHLKEDRSFFIDPATGRVSLPDGVLTDSDGDTAPLWMYFIRLDFEYVNTSSNSVLTARRPVSMKNSNQSSKARNSLIAPPTKKYPIAEQMSDYIQVDPYNIRKIFLTYLRQPLTPLWAFTTVNNRPVYDSANSTDIDVPYLNKNDIAMIYLKYQGIHLNDTELANFATQMQQIGV